MFVSPKKISFLFAKGTLRVYAVRYGEVDREYLWDISGDQGIEWRRASVDVDTNSITKVNMLQRADWTIREPIGYCSCIW